MRTRKENREIVYNFWSSRHNFDRDLEAFQLAVQSVVQIGTIRITEGRAPTDLEMEGIADTVLNLYQNNHAF